jgi:hypothetical protein
VRVTAIAWDGHTLAADTRCETEDGAIVYGTKIWRTPRGLFGGAGDDVAVGMVLTWLRLGNSKRHKAPVFAADTEFTGILVERSALWLIDKNVSPVRYFQQKTAIGTGGPYAIALMATGLSARESVQKIIDDRLAPGVGGEVQTLTLKKRKAGIRKKN